MAEETKTVNNQKRVIILLVIVIIVLVAGGGALAYHFLNQGGGEGEGGGDDVPELGYAEGTTVVRDGDALQKALDDMAEKMAKGSMMLEYDGDLYSVNGKDFAGYLANAAENNYDMYFDMYNAQDTSEQLYLSGLLKPGTALDKIKLKTDLPDGDHQAILFFTSVEDDHKTIHSQISVAVTLHVGAQYAKK